MSRKYFVTVKMGNTQQEIVMHTNPQMNDIQDIWNDFIDKIDSNPKHLGSLPTSDFTITCLRNTKGHTVHFNSDGVIQNA